MDILQQLLVPFSLSDLVAFTLFAVSWLSIGPLIEHRFHNRDSAHTLMRDYRRDWMRQMVVRKPRIYDATVLGNLNNNTSFFASACMIAIGGCFALLGQTDHLRDMAGILADGSTPPVLVWEAKIMLVLLLIAHAFLKFVWAVRLFGYCAVVMSAVPEGEPTDEAYRIADRAAWLNIFAARNFNRGLRSIYFALAALFWLIGPLAMLLATASTCIMLWRREFHSLSRAVLLGQRDEI